MDTLTLIGLVLNVADRLVHLAKEGKTELTEEEFLALVQVHKHAMETEPHWKPRNEPSRITTKP